jgi:hypothetical protein
MEAVTRPSYYDYKAQVDNLVTRGELTTEQGIILLICFKATLNETPVHINYLIAATGLSWQRINAVLNGLVLRKGIRKIEQKYYMV